MKKLRNPSLTAAKARLLDLQHQNDAKIGDIDSYLGYWLRFVSNQVSAGFQQRLAEKGATVAEWIVLRFLLTHAPCSLTRLADEMGMNKGALSRLVERLSQRGLIQCIPSSQDRRLLSIELTAAGLKLVPELAQIADENDRYFFGHLEKKEKNLIMTILKDIVDRHQFRGTPTD
jgi:DNA-binding MarR family transcriptional regulator